MKAEDVKRLFLDVRAKLGHGNLWWEYQDQALLTELARACEQHGIERAKQLVYLDAWESLDAEVEEENRRET